jgi:hypothetical protein
MRPTNSIILTSWTQGILSSIRNKVFTEGKGENIVTYVMDCCEYPLMDKTRSFAVGATAIHYKTKVSEEAVKT